MLLLKKYRNYLQLNASGVWWEGSLCDSIWSHLVINVQLNRVKFGVFLDLF